MTTTDTEQVEETVEETVEKRKIDDLLKADTYQGMTDEEIQSIVDYYKADYYQKGYNAAMSDEAKKTSATILSAMEQRQREARSRYLDALAVKTTFARTTGSIS